MILKPTHILVFASVQAVAIWAQGASAGNVPTAPVPNDPFEIIAGTIQTAATAESRQSALQLLARARDHYDLHHSKQAYRLQVSFTANSGGATRYDGAWKMEEVFVPGSGTRWTATTAGGYTTTRIAAKQRFYEEGTANTVPFRLHQARAALFGAIATPRYADRDRIRTSAAAFRGRSVTCVLLSPAKSLPTSAAGRRWEESEECVDPQSGLLALHSLAPGYYEAYDYSNGSSLGDYRLPGKITIEEGGNTVMTIQVDGLTPLDSADPHRFEPSDAMKSGEPGVQLGEAQRISFFANFAAVPNHGVADPVCVLGLITPSGKLVDAHSLQPNDPHSAQALETARQMTFSATAAPGERPVQRFVLITEKFVVSAGTRP